jgi:hypothetical protein
MFSRARAFGSATALIAAVLVGPRCVSAQRTPDQPPVLTAFSINAGADSVSMTETSVSLAHTIVGTRPSQYRVSHRADFAGARWEPYSPTLSLRDWYDPAGPPCNSDRATHRVTLYLQVRATLGEELRVVDGQRQLMPARVESNVLRASVCAHPPSKSPDGVLEAKLQTEFP